jgi:hypothetical protein
MYKIVLLFLFGFLGMNAYSQQQYFVYIQAENNQPFYVRMNEKIHSSSENGYLILSKLTENKYDFFIGFARNAYPEQHFVLTIGNQDRGYRLKQFEDKGWALSDLQNQQVVLNTDAASGAPVMGERKTDPFSVMLANVVNDSAILYTQVKPAVPVTTQVKTTEAQEKEKEALVKEEAATIVRDTVSTQPVIATNPEKKVTPARDSVITAAVEIQKDTVLSSVTTPRTDSSVIASQTQQQVPVKEKPAIEKPFISRIKETKTAESYQAIYLEQYNYHTDTIDIAIAVEPITAVSSSNPKLNSAAQQPVKAPAQQVPATRKDSNSVVLQIGSVTDTFQVKKRTVIMINSDCKNFATENDVDKLRIRILGEKSIDDQLNTARKYYKNKCFTVKQLRALTELFATDENKYRFLDLSYAFASDSGNYYLLEEVMGEDYYKNRFRAMIRK